MLVILPVGLCVRLCAEGCSKEEEEPQPSTVTVVTQPGGVPQGGPGGVHGQGQVVVRKEIVTRNGVKQVRTTVMRPVCVPPSQHTPIPPQPMHGAPPPYNQAYAGQAIPGQSGYGQTRDTARLI